jgi:hypothetical protein
MRKRPNGIVGNKKLPSAAVLAVTVPFIPEASADR